MGTETPPRVSTLQGYILGRADDAWGQWPRPGNPHTTPLVKGGLPFTDAREHRRTLESHRGWSSGTASLPGDTQPLTVPPTTQFNGIRKPASIWSDLPERFGTWYSVWRRFDRWARKGTWARASSGNSWTLTWNGCCSIAPNSRPPGLHGVGASRAG